MYLDANNLYDYAMSQYLPAGGFKWLTERQIDKIIHRSGRVQKMLLKRTFSSL